MEIILSKVRILRFIKITCPVFVDISSIISKEFWSGRTGENNVVVFPKQNFSPGEIVDVTIEDCTSATLIGKVKKKSIAI